MKTRRPRCGKRREYPANDRGRRIDEETVIDRVRMFIQKQPVLDGLEDGALLKVLSVTVAKAPRVSATGIVITSLSVAEPAEQMVHGEAPVAARKVCGSLFGAQVIIGWAFVNADRSRREFAEHAINHPGNIGVAAIISTAARPPGHDIIYPIVKGLNVNGIAGRGHAVVVWHPVIPFTTIKMPGSAELFGIAQANDLLGFNLGAMQGRQEQSG